jgi:NAD-dependent SIR2 family protein deacetylase
VFHPEVEGSLGDVLKEFEKMELVDVYCNGCGAFVKMNSNYAKHLNGEINSCAKCRGLKLK